MNPYLLPTLEFGPTVVRRLLSQLPPSRMDEEMEEGRFTPREVIAHLADWEPIMRDRIVSALKRPGTTITAYDEVKMAIDHGYSLSDPSEQCDLFARERRITAQLVRDFKAMDWDKAVIHPERGPLSVEDLTNLLIGHDLYHIEQLSAYLQPK
jgi:hypothetical protein